MNSATVLAGNDGLTTMTNGERPKLATGAISRMKLKLSVVVERRAHCARQNDHEQCVAVRWRSHDQFGADIAAGARPVIDDDLLPEPLRQPLTHEAREGVGPTAGGKANNQMHRPRWIGLRPCDPRDGRERSGARCQMQKSATGKFHG